MSKSTELKREYIVLDEMQNAKLSIMHFFTKSDMNKTKNMTTTT